ncbi:calcium-transporting P-type ATPase, PMR1-type [Desulforamulus hydrothermalis]|uniref:P-type Ca(2+) transporter n=1 Tax=Desulforamulus hydrothermalis Lam5 = DSM 18033 TaxID=1121428 RepID=K8DXC0_9FIRM|nr:calcium-transporting P-type ATPase, PMR1-type [Desulforamulus hydrothermalis]CCO07199.1 Calcium-transporting ATPase [Desulforamulus hydrothermalis Lam5 = DSM 18033]SHG88036.1 Ca2+-transporting ATPase [Desulforamulus hydrothermalis Lam5 = DSM 18033]
MTARWFALTRQEVTDKLATCPHKGLDEQQARERLAQFGPNQLVSKHQTPPWKMFFDQFKDFMVLVLLAATLVSGFLGEWADAVTIMVIVVVNAVLGFIQEYRAEKSMEALKALTAPEARVIRSGLERKVPAAQLVPGDIVLLDTGDKVPADMRLWEAANLEVEESALTGESNPVKKRVANMAGQEDVSLGDTRNMAYMGTVVVRGRGKGVVVATGMQTEMGQITKMIQEAAEDQTPLQRRLEQLGKTLVVFCLIICALVVLLGVMRGEPLYQMFLAGVSLAVAAIPEGLPAIVTIALAIGVQRMIKRNAIIRRLPAVETLGCATVICSDKTGTLTENKMTVREALVGKARIKVSGEGYDPKGEFRFEGTRGPEFELFLKCAALCNNARLTRGEIPVGNLFRSLKAGQLTNVWGVAGDPTEGALLVMAAKGKVWRQDVEQTEKRILEFPFDSTRKRMSVVYQKENGGLTAYVKGAPDIILDMCTHICRDGRLVPLTETIKQEILQQNSDLAKEALRVLALAYRDLPSVNEGEELKEDFIEQQLVFLGLAGMLDPPRPAAVQAVQACRRAGIRTVMITGDHRLTAQAVGKELGLLFKGCRVISGTELDRMSDEELQETAVNTAIYARVTPRHKLRIVRALKRNGHVVAMTGDGVNDAPAVKEADIGVAMGQAGTDVTKEASAMVLADDNFSTIVAAIEEGRAIYDNIRKFIRYLLSCNVGEVLTMFLAVLMGMPLPLLPIQILWMNLVTDGLPAMALGVDPADKDLMYRRPRDPQESVFSHGLGRRIVSTGILFALGTLVAFAVGLMMGPVELARTMAFNTLVFFQLFFVFSCRSERHSILETGLLGNPQLVLAVAVSACLQLAVNYIGFLQPVFHTVPLALKHWLVVLAIALLPQLSGIIIKAIKDRAKERIMYIRA